MDNVPSAKSGIEAKKKVQRHVWIMFLVQRVVLRQKLFF